MPASFTLTKVAASGAVVVGVVIGAASAVALLRDSPIDWFLGPSLIGLILVGGVHNGAPDWLMVSAMATSNAVVWALGTYTLVRVGLLLRERLASRGAVPPRSNEEL